MSLRGSPRIEMDIGALLGHRTGMTAYSKECRVTEHMSQQEVAADYAEQRLSAVTLATSEGPAGSGIGLSHTEVAEEEGE